MAPEEDDKEKEEGEAEVSEDALEEVMEEEAEEETEGGAGFNEFGEPTEGESRERDWS